MRLSLARERGLPPREFDGQPWRLPKRFLVREMLPFSWRQALNRGFAAGRVAFLSDDGSCVVSRGRRFAVPRETPAELILATWHEVFVGYPPNGHCYWTDSCAIEAGDVVFDVGAAEGFFTQLAVERGAELVVCFEPSEEWAASLRSTFRKEIAAHRVRVECVAAGLANRTAAARALDEMVFERGLPRPDFIKIDVEGAELEVLRSACRLLAEGRLRLALATYHTSVEAGECLDFLTAISPDYQFEFRGLSRSLDRGVLVPQILSAWLRN